MSSVLPTLDSPGLDLATLSIARISLCHEGGGDVATVGIPLMAWVRWQLFGGDVTIEQSQATISCFDASTPRLGHLYTSQCTLGFSEMEPRIYGNIPKFGGGIYIESCVLFSVFV